MKKTATFLIIIVLVVAVAMVAAAGARYLFPKGYGAYVEAYAREYGLDPYLVYAVIKAESNFQTDAVSHKDAVGLMQLTPKTAAWCAEKMGEPNLSADLCDPENSIRLGCWYLAYLLERFGNMDTALSAYNAGEGNVQSWLKDAEHSDDGVTLKDIPFAETKKYRQKIAIYERIYRFLYETK